MADEDIAKQARRGDRYIDFRGQVQSAFQALNQVKNRIGQDRADLETEFGPASDEVAEVDALFAALQARVTNFAAGY